MSPDLIQISQPPFLIQNINCGRLNTKSLIENSIWTCEALSHIATRTFTNSHKSSKLGWEPLKTQSLRCFHVDQRIAKGRTIQIFFFSFFILHPNHQCNSPDTEHGNTHCIPHHRTMLDQSNQTKGQKRRICSTVSISLWQKTQLRLALPGRIPILWRKLEVLILPSQASQPKNYTLRGAKLFQIEATTGTTGPRWDSIQL